MTRAIDDKRPLGELLLAATTHRFLAALNYITLSDSLRETVRSGWPVSPAETGYVEQAGRAYDEASRRLAELEAIRERKTDEIADVMRSMVGAR